MAQCLEMLGKIATELVDAAKQIEAKDWYKLIPLAVEIAKDAYADFNCFKNNNTSVAQMGFKFIMDTSGDQKECIMEHLKNAINDVSEIPSDVLSGDWDSAKTAINNAADEVQAALNCQ